MLFTGPREVRRGNYGADGKSSGGRQLNQQVGSKRMRKVENLWVSVGPLLRSIKLYIKFSNGGCGLANLKETITQVGTCLHGSCVDH